MGVYRVNNSLLLHKLSPAVLNGHLTKVLGRGIPERGFPEKLEKEKKMPHKTYVSEANWTHKIVPKADKSSFSDKVFESITGDKVNTTVSIAFPFLVCFFVNVLHFLELPLNRLYKKVQMSFVDPS